MHDLTFIQRIQISDAHRESWYRTLAALIAEGNNVYSVIDEMSQEFARSKDPLLPVVVEIKARLRGGGDRSVHRSSSKRTFGSELIGLVPVNEAKLIDSGETSGDLAAGCSRAADYVSAMGKLKGEVLKPLREPLLLIVILLCVLVFFSIEVLPSFSGVSPRHKWPMYARAFGMLADNSIPIAIGTVGTIVAVGTWLKWASANWTNSARYMADKSIWPMTLIARLNAASMLTALAGFVAAGVPFSTAIQKLQDSTTPYMRQIYGDLHTHMRNGRTPYDALAGIHIIPISQHWLIRLYGKSTNFSAALESISEKLVNETLQVAKSIFGVVSLLLKLFVAGFVIWAIGSMFGVFMSIR